MSIETETGSYRWAGVGGRTERRADRLGLYKVTLPRRNDSAKDAGVGKGLLRERETAEKKRIFTGVH